MTPADKLLQIATRRKPITPEALAAPNWESGRWRWEFYVDEDVAGMWEHLPLEARLIAFIYACDDSASDDPTDSCR